MKLEDKKILEEMKTMGTLSHTQALEFHKLLAMEELESTPVETSKVPEVQEVVKTKKIKK